jgi:N-acetylneuraminic acid mutarotase
LCNYRQFAPIQNKKQLDMDQMNPRRAYFPERKLIALFSLCTLLFVGLLSCEKAADDDDDYVGNWVRKSEFEGVGRTEAVTFTIDNKVYVGGGFDGDDRLNDFWEYNQQTGTWIRKADFPGTPRSSAVAFSIDGKGYVGTGLDEDDNELGDFWEYNPQTNSWKQVANFGGTGRYNAVGFSISGKGYVATGYDGNFLKDLWEYDPRSNTWTQKSSYGGSKRSEAVVFVYQNKAYLVTGVNNGSYLNDFWVYDPVTNEWEEKERISDVTDESFDDDYGDNIRRSNAVAFIMGNRAYLTSGTRNGLITTTWQYNFENDTWSERTYLEGASRQGALGFSIGNRGYVVSGSNGGSYFDDLWEFFPDAEQDDDDN